MKRPLVTAIYIWLLHASCLLGAHAAPNNPAVKLETPAWLMKKEAGLSRTRAGRFVYKSQTLPPVSIQGHLYGAAYYPRCKMLLTVTKEGSVRCYAIKNQSFTQLGGFKPSCPARTFSVRFSRVPGLAYLQVIDIKLDTALHRKPASGKDQKFQPYLKSYQHYPSKYYRLALISSAKPWHGIPVTNSDEHVLGGGYTNVGRQIHLSLPHNRTLTLDILRREKLAAPSRSGPYDELAQSVYLFPGRGITCLTTNGWALYDWRGRLRRWFFRKRAESDWWSDPVYKNGSFFVERRTGPGGDWYRMDVKSGRLVKAAA